jgi:hypothetical protein
MSSNNVILKKRHREPWWCKGTLIWKTRYRELGSPKVGTRPNLRAAWQYNNCRAKHGPKFIYTIQEPYSCLHNRLASNAPFLPPFLIPQLSTGSVCSVKCVLKRHDCTAVFFISFFPLPFPFSSHCSPAISFPGHWCRRAGRAANFHLFLLTISGDCMDCLMAIGELFSTVSCRESCCNATLDDAVTSYCASTAGKAYQSACSSTLL